MALLPNFFVLQSGGNYLSATENIPASRLPSGFLKFDEEQIWSPRVKFAVERAKTTGKERLVHIRSCYNNKYLVMKQIETNSWIVASAKNPEEDQTKDSCTLFEPYSLADDQTSTVGLRHVQTGISITRWLSPDDDTHQGVVLLSASTGSVFSVTDPSTDVLKLPSEVAFKSEHLNGDYLRSISLYDNLIYQKFDSGFDMGDQRVAKKLFPAAEGKYRIQDLYSGKFWRRRDNWIKGEVLVDDDDDDDDTLFSFVQIKDNVFGLRNLGNNAFCGAYTESKSINCLCAFYPTLSKQTRLMVEERVLERQISNLEYHLRRSRIYNEKIQQVSNAFATNNSPDKDATITLSFTTTVSKTNSWNNSLSANFGVKVSFEITVIPFIASGNVEVSADIGYTHEWGGSETTEYTKQSTYSVVVPPLTKMMVTMMCTQASCDVPFTYTHRDLLTTGKWVTTVVDDGIYTGINSYNFYFESSVVEQAQTQTFGRSWTDVLGFKYFLRGLSWTKGKIKIIIMGRPSWW